MIRFVQAQTDPEAAAMQALVQKNWVEAEKKFAKLLEQKPSFLDYQTNYLIVLTELKRFEQALKVADQILKLHPSEEASIRMHKAEIYLQQQKSDSCFVELERILVISPNDLRVLLKKAWLEFELQQYDLAIATYSTILVQNELIAEAWYGRGAAYYMRDGSVKVACENWARAVELEYEPVQAFVKQFCQ